MDPFLHASVAKVRVLYSRTAQSHLSNRSVGSFSWVDIKEWMRIYLGILARNFIDSLIAEEFSSLGTGVNSNKK
jgi:hypothetical protein